MEKTISKSNQNKIKTWQTSNYKNIKNLEILKTEPCCNKELTKCEESPKKQLDDEIRETYKSALRKDKTINQRKNVKLKCMPTSKFTECVHERRTSTQLKKNAIMREKAAIIIKQLKEVRHKHPRKLPPFPELGAVKKLESPTSTGAGKVMPKKASPSCSAEEIYVPSRRMLDLKTPRSGIFLNEQELPKNIKMPYKKYNPRLLQSVVNKVTPHTLIQKNKRLYIRMDEDITSEERWNNSKETENACTDPCCCLFFKKTFEDADEFEECLHNFPKFFKIPDDLHEDFVPNCILGTTRCKREKEDNVKEIDKRRPKSVAALYIAFFKSLITSFNEWNGEIIDEIVETGAELCEKSIEWCYENKESYFDIIPEDEENQITIKLQFFLEGTLNCYNPNILKALTLYFRNGQACLIRCRTLFLVIWKTCNGFYAFDPNARTQNLERNWYTGKAALIKLQHLEHLVHIILNLSDLKENDVYNMYDIQLINFGAIPNPVQPMKHNRKKKNYLIVNKYYALIPGTKGILPPEDAEDRNVSLLVVLIGRLYAGIDAPSHWTRNTIDNLIKFGERLYRRLKLKSINVRTLPSTLFIGSFQINFEIIPFLYGGFITYCTNYRFSPLTSSVIQLFEQHNGALIEIDSSALAVWRDDHFYYSFDPFERGPNGRVIDTDEDSGYSILQMHLTLESFCRMLYANALDMKNTGNFFIHAVLVKSVIFFNQNQNLRGKELLKINFPSNCDADLGIKEEISCSNAPELLMSALLPSIVGDECLSTLSVRPCERACSESEVYEKEKKDRAKLKREERLKHAESLESLSDSAIIPEEDSGDIVLHVVEQIICLTMVEIAFQSREPAKSPIRAKKVLIKSDLDYLETLKLKTKRGLDYDNTCESFRKKRLNEEEKISLHAELAIPSNYSPLPDGSGMVKGNYDSGLYDNVTCVIAGIVAYLASLKYNISTWDSDIVDYVMKTASNTTLFLPLFYGKEIKIDVNKKIYRLILKKIDSGNTANLREILKRCFTQFYSIILLFKHFACGIIRRYNFFYLYITNSDLMGFFSWSSSSTPCCLRLYDFSLLVNRIDFNRSLQNGNGEETFSVLRLEAKDISPDKRLRFYPLTPSDEELIYLKDLEVKMKFDKRNSEKLAFLNDELKKEKERISGFLEEKEGKPRKAGADAIRIEKRRRTYEDGAEDEDEMEESFKESEEEIGEIEEDQDIEKKHKPGQSSLVKKEESFHFVEPLGYRYTDNFFKISGKLETSKTPSNLDKPIGLCFFAGVYAILFAIMRPLSRWNSDRIDQVWRYSQELFETVSNKNFACTRKINNLQVDSHRFNVSVQVFQDNRIRVLKADISEAIKNISKTKQYFLLNISTTFAIYKDKYWHLFDLYWTDNKNSKSYGAWLLFPNLNIMLEYIGQKAESDKWKSQYKLHVVDILLFRKLPRRKIKVLEDVSALTAVKKEKKLLEDINCLEQEQIEWVHYCPFWSRILDKNMMGAPRGLNITIWKAFDIELSNKVFSLWGSLHPLTLVFEQSRGKQYLAVNVIACCMANLYPVTEWNSLVIDTIVVHGNEYFNQSINEIDLQEYEFALEDLNTKYEMDFVQWKIHLESIIFGKLYNKKRSEFNLSSALRYFFSNKNEYGIIQCQNKSLAFGIANKGYFIFDCQSHGPPVFQKSEGCAYVLLCIDLKYLLQCITVALSIPFHDINFVMYKIEMQGELTKANKEKEVSEESEKRHAEGEEEVEEEAE